MSARYQSFVVSVQEVLAFKIRGKFSKKGTDASEASPERRRVCPFSCVHSTKSPNFIGRFGPERLRFVFFVMILLVGLRGQGEGAPLRLLVSPDEGSAYAGVPFHVVCSVSWDGEVDEYIVLPAELETLDWGTVTVTSLRASLEDGRPVITQIIEIVPKSVGTYTVPNIPIPYVVGGSLPADQETPGQVAKVVESFEMTVLAVPSDSFPWGGWVFIAVLVLVVSGVLLVRRRKGEDAVKVLSPLERVQGALHAAKRHRLDGNYYAYYQDLTRVATLLSDGPTADRELLEVLERRTQEVGYRGLRPSEDEIDGDQRDIERAVARWKEESKVCSPM